MALVGLTILLLGLRARPRLAQVGVALGIAVVYLLVFVRMAIPEERTHLIEYGVLGVLVYQALLERQRNAGAPRRPAILAIAITALLGLVDELIQRFLPGRVFDPRDILFNLLAGTMAVLACVALDRAGRWQRKMSG